MRNRKLRSIAMLCLACLALAACEGVNIDEPTSRSHVMGGRGAGAGGG